MRNSQVITIKEIAQLAGTSRGTVDRVLHKRGNVNPRTAAEIMRIAEEHDYKSNPFAKALVKGKHRQSIGVVMNSKGNRFFEDVLNGINDAASKYKEYGLEVFIKQIKGYKEMEQIKAIDDLMQHDLAALAITPIDTPMIADKLSEIAYHPGIPIITLNNDLHFDNKLAFIGCDYLNSGMVSGDIANLCLPRGGRICIVTGSFLVMGHNDRIRGFSDVVRLHPNIEVATIVENNDDNKVSYKVTEKLIAEESPDLIYFCAAGTEGGVRAVKEANKEIKVIVVDDIEPMRDYLNAGDIQAIVTQQAYQQGVSMVETIYNYLYSGNKPAHVHNYTDNKVMLKHTHI
jgi:LacI family transcriptional regulator